MRLIAAKGLPRTCFYSKLSTKWKTTDSVLLGSSALVTPHCKRGMWPWTGSHWIYEEMKSKDLRYSQQGPQREASAQGTCTRPRLSSRPLSMLPPAQEPPEEQRGWNRVRAPLSTHVAMSAQIGRPFLISRWGWGQAVPHRVLRWRRPLDVSPLPPARRQQASQPGPELQGAERPTRGGLSKKGNWGCPGWDVHGWTQLWTWTEYASSFSSPPSADPHLSRLAPFQAAFCRETGWREPQLTHANAGETSDWALGELAPHWPGPSYVPTLSVITPGAKGVWILIGQVRVTGCLWVEPEARDLHGCRRACRSERQLLEVARKSAGPAEVAEWNGSQEWREEAASEDRDGS